MCGKRWSRDGDRRYSGPGFQWPLAPPDECPSSCPPRPRPSGSGFHFPHLTWGNPRAGTSPPGRPRLRLFIPHPRHTFSALHSPPRKGTHRSGAPAQAPAQPCRMASGCPLEGSRAGCCPVSLLLFQELLSPLFWEVFMRGQRVTPPLPSLPSPLRGRGGEPSPGNHLCATPAAFSLALSCSCLVGAPGGQGGAGCRQGGQEGPCPVSTLPTFSLSQGPPKGQRWELGASTLRILASRSNPHFLAQTLTSCTYPLGGNLDIDVFLLTPEPQPTLSGLSPDPKPCLCLPG